MENRDFLNIFKKYTEVRPAVVPFQIGSTLVFYLLVKMIAEKCTNKTFLELGVENGGSALFLMLCMDSNDHIYLIDQRKTETFIQAMKKVKNISPKQISYIFSRTSDERAFTSVKKKCDFIHIDAGHKYGQVKQDIEQYLPFLSDYGIVAIDDFFQARWPGVTEAVYDTVLSDSSDNGLHPFLIGFNKLYLCRQQLSESYNKLFANMIYQLSNEIGTFEIIDTLIHDNLPVKFIQGSFKLRLKR